LDVLGSVGVLVGILVTVVGENVGNFVWVVGDFVRGATGTAVGTLERSVGALVVGFPRTVGDCDGAALGRDDRGDFVGFETIGERDGFRVGERSVEGGRFGIIVGCFVKLKLVGIFVPGGFVESVGLLVVGFFVIGDLVLGSFVGFEKLGCFVSGDLVLGMFVEVGGTKKVGVLETGARVGFEGVNVGIFVGFKLGVEVVGWALGILVRGDRVGFLDGLNVGGTGDRVGL
jgi:hypothetical protein